MLEVSFAKIWRKVSKTEMLYSRYRVSIFLCIFGKNLDNEMKLGKGFRVAKTFVLSPMSMQLLFSLISTLYAKYQFLMNILLQGSISWFLSNFALNCIYEYVLFMVMNTHKHKTQFFLKTVPVRPIKQEDLCFIFNSIVPKCWLKVN